MKFNIKKTVVSLLLSSMIFSTACSVAGEEAPEMRSFFYNGATAVVEMIDSITEATFETEKLIEDAYSAYCELPTEYRSEVTNYGKLADMRQQIAELYNTEGKQGSRFSRSQILIGTYGVGSMCWTNEGIKALADCGIDFVASGSGDRTLLDLLDKYGIGNFVSGIVPGWYGGDGSNAGTMSAERPLELYDASVETFEDHPAIWGICVGDEPSILDAEHYGKVVAKVNELFPEQFSYLNLYPNCGSTQLGTENEQEYYDTYAELIPNDYICYDHYPISSYDSKKRKEGFGGFIKNMSCVYNSAQKYNKDLWVVMQSSTHDNVVADFGSDYLLSEDEMRIQASISLAFGAKAFSWACWSQGWYHNHVVDSEGRITSQYYVLQKVNSEVEALSPVYCKYSSKSVGYVGGMGAALFPESKVSRLDYDRNIFKNVSADSASAVLVGYSEKNNGNGFALMFANVSDLMCSDDADSAWITFAVADKNAEIRAYCNGEVVELKELGNCEYGYSLANAANLFVTVE